MITISRRRFLGTSAIGIAGPAYLTGDPLKMPIGCQTWTVREKIGKDFDGTLRQLAADGYGAIELCSPPGYKDSGFGPLIGMKASEMRDRIHKAGLQCVSSHYGFGELKDHLDERIAYAKELGLTQMIVSSFGLPKEAKLEDWTKAAAETNKLGEKSRKAGIQMGFHNHHGEFQKINGTLIYDELMRAFDPQLVKMQFQVGVVSLGYQAADYFEKYPGRFISMHLQDWSPTEQKDVPLGKGIVDWKRAFAAAKKGGVKNYFVEMDPEVMKAGLPYLHSLT